MNSIVLFVNKNSVFMSQKLKEVWYSIGIVIINENFSSIFKHYVLDSWK